MADEQYLVFRPCRCHADLAWAAFSVAKCILERMDAFLDEIDARGRMPFYGKVALAVIVSNEDGADHTPAELFQPHWK